MSKINWSRFMLAGLVAAILAFFSDGLMHEKILEPDWQALYARLGATSPAHTSTSLLYFAIFELGRGFVTMFLYVMMRDRFGRGAKTAALAGVVGWLLFSVATPAQFIPLGFYSNELLIKAGVIQLVAAVISTIAGAAIYKDEGSLGAAV